MPRFHLWVCLFAVLLEIGTCAVPEDISNYQNEYVCSPDVRVVRPLSINDVKEAVRRHARVQAVGTGHSWNKFFCAPSPSTTQDPHDTSANIAMATIRPLKIEVNEMGMYVWVSAGAMLWDLMDYLGNYVTPVAPRGYALNAHPGNVNQTVGGTIGTGSHGSSISYRTLSSHVLAVKAVLANGTSVVISQESHPFLLKAFRVNVGRLGVVTELKIRIHKEVLVRRSLWSAVPFAEVLLRLKQAQEMYKTTGDLPEWLDGTTLVWMATNSTFEITNVNLTADAQGATQSECHHPWCYRPSAESVSYLEALESRINSPVDLQRSEAGRDIADGVRWTVPAPLPPIPYWSFPNTTAAQELSWATRDRTFRNNATVETHYAIPTVSPSFVETIQNTLVDDYSVGIPADKMADCLDGIASVLDSMGAENGLRSPNTLRFVGKEDALLSSSYHEPIMRMDFNDVLYYHRETRRSNERMKKLLAFVFTSPLCSPAQRHWGKSGWPDPGCWNGVDFYKEAWCAFGCAVLELDPLGKFIGEDPNLWNWNEANLEYCCTPDGYDTSLEGCGCDVIPVRTPDECPEAPFFTNR